MATNADEVDCAGSAALGTGRVVFINRFFYPDESATSQLLSDLAFHLAAEGMAVHVITGRQRYDDPQADLPAHEVLRGVEVHRVWSSRYGRARLATRALDYLSFYAGATIALLRVARRGDVLVAKTDPPLISVPTAVVARLKRARLVNWVQDLFPEVAMAYGMRAVRGPLGAMARWVRDRSFRGAAANVVLGEAMAARIQAAAVRGRVRIIPNWSDGEAIRPVAPVDNRLRDEWRLEERFVVGYSGNFGRVHDASAILAAAQALAGEPDIRLLMIGGGVQRERLETECRNMAVANVDFRPFQPRERLRESLGAADVHLVSLRSDMEGLVFPSKLYGVLAAGRPVIFLGARGGEIAHLLEDAGCGMGLAQDDAEGLVAAIRELAADPERCRDMGRRARELFEARYERQIALDRWRDLIDEVARGAELANAPPH